MKILITIAAITAWVAVATGAILLLILSWLSIAHAASGLTCAQHTAVLAQMAKQYAEYPASKAITNSDAVLLERLESHRNDGKPETWTIVIVRPDGLTCLLAAGEDWQELKPEPPGSGI